MEDFAWAEKKLTERRRAKAAIDRTGAVKHDWQCECGCVLRWDSDEARDRHRRSRKHTEKLSRGSLNV
jgi:hypothetical protein